MASTTDAQCTVSMTIESERIIYLLLMWFTMVTMLTAVTNHQITLHCFSIFFNIIAVGPPPCINISIKQTI